LQSFSLPPRRHSLVEVCQMLVRPRLRVFHRHSELADANTSTNLHPDRSNLSSKVRRVVFRAGLRMKATSLTKDAAALVWNKLPSIKASGKPSGSQLCFESARLGCQSKSSGYFDLCLNLRCGCARHKRRAGLTTRHNDCRWNRCRRLVAC